MRKDMSNLKRLRPWTIEDNPEKFWSKLGPKDENGCINWTGSLSELGYGMIVIWRFKRKAKSTVAHRLSWRLQRGIIPDGLKCCHHCDNRKCVNVDHLFLGTQADNIHDMMRKNRNGQLKGSENGRSKLTENEVLEIRQLYEDGFLWKDLGPAYGVSSGLIGHIVQRRNWKHI